MKFLKHILAVFLISCGSLLADQTFDAKTAYTHQYYYGVPAKLTIVEVGEPTDYYISYLSEDLTWEQITPKYVWGLGNITTTTWLPLTTFEKSYLGIHTSIRNEGNYSFEPTDVTDTTVTVSFANGSLSLSGTEYIYKDDFGVVFYYNHKTLPETVQLQYSYNGVNWLDLKNLNLTSADSVAYTFYNDLFKDQPIKFRVTYNLVYGQRHNIAITDWVNYKGAELKIIDKGTWETGIWDDNSEFAIELQRYNYKDQDILPYLVLNSDTIALTPIKSVESFFSFNLMKHTFLKDYNGSVKILFYSSWGELLNSLTLKFSDKYLTLSETPEVVEVGTPFTLFWSNTTNFKKVRIEESKDGSIFTEVVNDWDINKPYTIIRGEIGKFIFKVIAFDDYQTFVKNTNTVNVVSYIGCDSLVEEIIVLKNKIDSLSSLSSDSLIIVLIVDRTTGVLKEYTLSRGSINQIIPINDVIYLTGLEGVVDVYISDYLGGILKSISTDGGVNYDMNISNVPFGFYFLFTVDKNNNIKSYKFVKQ